MNTNRYKRTRDVHSKESAEDYVELIDDLINERGEARVVDIAAKLAVSNVAVSKAVQRLQRDGFVSSLPYRSIFLTDLGKELAARAKVKHKLVHDFLLSLGVSAGAADSDAEGIYHHVSEETLTAMKKHLEPGQ
jgi:DtxR family transcriptional regulator, manganese transport regulator